MRRIKPILLCICLASLISTKAQVRVIAPINPSSPLDLYPTHIDTLGHGGFMAVRTKIIRDNIPPLRRKEGMLVYVAETDSLYQLKGGILNSFWTKYKLSDAGSTGIEWQGSLSAAPADPLKNWAYYNTLDKRSYIWNGSSWNILSQDGIAGMQGPQGENSIVWKGNQTVAPVSPMQNWAYYDIIKRVSFIWNTNTNNWDTLAPGGIGFLFVGSDFDPDWGTVPPPTNPPANPVVNTLYRDPDAGLVYIYDGSAWKLFIKDGLAGDEGPMGPQGPPGPTGQVTSGVMIWLGMFASAPNEHGEPIAINSAYYDQVQRKSFIWDGSQWQILAQDGHVLMWLGELSYEPTATAPFQAYRNTTLRKSFFWAYNPTTQQVQWNIFAEDGWRGDIIEFKQTFSDSVIFNNPGDFVTSNGEMVVIDSKIKLPFSRYGTWDPNRFDLDGTAPPVRRFLLGMSDSNTLALVEPMSEYVRMSREFDLNKRLIPARGYLDTLIGMVIHWTYQGESQQQLALWSEQTEIAVGPIVTIPQTISIFDPANAAAIIALEKNAFPDFIQVFSVRGFQLGVAKTINNYYFYAYIRFYNNSDTDYQFDVGESRLLVSAIGMVRRFNYSK